jgi:hypothetical protein
MMYFIEKYIGHSPDGGNGSLEVAILVLAFMATAALALRVGHRHK